MTAATFDRAVAAVRTATAGMAVAVALLLAGLVPLIATFRAALIVLAALEILSFGRRALAGRRWVTEAAALALKLAILAAAYIVLR